MRNKSFNLFINSDAPVKPHRKILNASAIVSYDKTNDNHNLKKKKSKTKTIRKK